MPFLSWHLSEALQLSTLPGIRNQTQSHLTSCELWTVTENMHMHARTQTHACMHKPWRNRTHSLPRARRREGSKGWWSQSANGKPACRTLSSCRLLQRQMCCFFKKSAAPFDCFVLKKFNKTCRPDRKQ